MSTQKKRIKAKKMTDEILYVEGFKGGPRMQGDDGYFIRQSDIRALAEQFVRDAIHFVYAMKESRGKERIDTALYMLRRAGMTPGRARKGGVK